MCRDVSAIPVAAADQRLRLRHPEHRRGGPEGRSRRPEGPLPEYRRPNHLRVPHAAAHDRRRSSARCGTATTGTRRRWASSRRARRSRRSACSAACRCRPTGSSSHPALRGDRARADGAGRARRRSADPGTDVSALHRGPREDRRDGGLLSHGSRARAGSPTSNTSAALITPATRALVVIDPNNPTGATYSERGAAGAGRSCRPAQHSRCSPTRSMPISRSTVRCGALAALNPEAPVITFSSLSKAYLAPGWRIGLAGGRRPPIGWTTCWPGSRSWRTAGCAARADGARARRRAHRRSVASAGLPRRAAGARRR